MSRQPRKPLQYEDSYPCPVCRQGRIRCLCMVEAFSCDLCDRIFSSDISQQSLTLETGAGPQAKKWYWRSNRWESERQITVENALGLQGLSLALIVLPTTFIGLPSYIFPPLPTQASISFPYLWTGLTFISHLAMVLWFWLDYYQISMGVMIRIRLQRWRWV